MLLKEFKDLRRKPDKRIGTPDLFNFAFLGAPGVMVLKDGALMKCLTYRGPDLNSASQLEISALKHHLNTIFSRYGDGFMINADLIRHSSIEYPTGGAFPTRPPRSSTASGRCTT
jgi:type IV secretion system protein VirB4